MNVSELLNPVNTNTPKRSRCVSTPVISNSNNSLIGKPRSRFSEYEDNIIRQGVANRLTWGQISDLLPHRKRATCFNRYRTLQGIRKSRKMSSSSDQDEMMMDHLQKNNHSYYDYNYMNPQPSYATDISSDSSFSSDDNDDFNTKRSHKISLPSIKSQSIYYHA